MHFEIFVLVSGMPSVRPIIMHAQHRGITWSGTSRTHEARGRGPKGAECVRAVRGENA